MVTGPHVPALARSRGLLTKTRLKLTSALMGAAAMGYALPALAAGDKVAGNLASWVASAKMTGSVAGSKTVHIAVHMALQNRPALASFVTAVSTPGSADYGKYLTPAEFAARYAPASTDVAAVEAMLTRAGMTGVTVGASGTYVAATATVAQLRQAFGVTQKMYQHGSISIRSNAELPTIPEALAGKVLFIEGLDDTDALRTPLHVSATQGPLVAPAASPAPVVTPPPVASQSPSPYCSTYFGDTSVVLSTAPAPYAKTLPWLNCGYTPAQIQAAYGLNPFGNGLDGRGVTVAIVDAYASPTLEGDANIYAANHGLPALTAANFSEVIPAGIYDVPAAEVTNAYGWWTEQALDVASVHGSAPGAAIVFVGSQSNDATLTEALMDTIYDHRADIITNSFGDNGEDVTPADVASEDQAFMAAAATGITVLFSSGDDGDLSQINGVATGSWEATSPYVTGVGGTSLLLTDKKGTKTEYGWGTYRDFLANATVNSATSITTTGLTQTTVDGSTYSDFAFYAGSGGGISLIEPQPAYQAGIVPAALATTLNDASGYQGFLPTAQRVSPDIAADADPYTGYLYPETYTIAGNVSDTGCTKLTATTEYCEIAEGGTSLASPLTAGVIATVDEIHGLTGKPFVGFANPWLYNQKIGKKTNSAGINQIKPPTTPIAVLRGYPNPNEVRVVTINSVPALSVTSPFPLEVCGAAICEGIDDVFNQVRPGYNDVTGLGVPYVPYLAFE